MSRITLLLLLNLLSWPALADLKLFTCEPEWAALARELGGERLSIYSATTAQQDPHRVQARPSLIAKMRRADLVVCTGADLEAGWLPVLLRRAANSRVQPGGDGYFEAAQHVTLLDKPQRLDRAEGDLHAAGDPHIHMDPRNIVHIATALSERLIKLDETHSADYQRNTADFLSRWQEAIQRWQQQAANLKGLPVLSQHKSWTYLIHWLGLKELARLETKPGIPPSAAHLSKIVTMMKQNTAAGILRAAYQDPRAAQWLHEKTAIPIINLPYTVGGNDESQDLFSLFDSTINQLREMQP